MNIDWDQFPADQIEQAPPASREPLSEGIHAGVIDRATIESGWRITPDNPSGDCLSIWLDCEEDGARKRVFVTVPVSQIGRISAIARSCGVEPPQRGNPNWDESALIGKACTVETGQWIVQSGPKQGETRASVRRWIAADEPKGDIVAAPAQAATAPKPPPAAMKTNRAAKATKGGSDDIPF